MGAESVLYASSFLSMDSFFFSEQAIDKCYGTGFSFRQISAALRLCNKEYPTLLRQLIKHAIGPVYLKLIHTFCVGRVAQSV